MSFKTLYYYKTSHMQIYISIEYKQHENYAFIVIKMIGGSQNKFFVIKILEYNEMGISLHKAGRGIKLKIACSLLPIAIFYISYIV